ncbi:MAG TPA: BON domain-containing protein [Terriglobales bacterium]|jgi:hypothetical protein|nr:BON domain-containing protein [Terriglobales bacterium]
MNAKRSVYVLLVVLLGLALLTSCSRGRNDAQIASEVQSKINSDASVANKQITVTSNNGVVTLAGTVGNETERAAAGNDAALVEGVRTVVNNLQVAPTTADMSAETASEAMQPEPAQPAVRTSARRRSAPRQAATRTSSAPAATPSYTPAAATAPAPIPAPKPVTIPDGTTLSVRMIDAIDTAQNQVGDTFRATLDAPITIGDQVVVPEGADIVGRVAEAKSSGRFAGRSEIALELSSLSYNGRRYSLQTSQYTRQGTSRGKRTAATVGGGAALGAIIGGIAGGGKGAAIGATIGAGAGTGVQAATKGQQIKVPSEAVLTFRLEAPLTVTPSASAQRRTQRVEEYNEPTVGETEDIEPPTLRRR